MKHIDMKKTLLMLVVICGLVFIFFFLNQTPGPPNPITHTSSAFKKLRKLTNDKTSAVWTWDCLNKRCERRERANENEPLTSLDTCNMICGSTQLWPQPTGPVTLGTRFVRFALRQLNYETDATEPSKSLLNAAFTLFTENVASIYTYNDPSNNTAASNDTDVKKFVIKIVLAESGVTKLRLDTDESYDLVVKVLNNDLSVSISAKNFFGARHALETLTQLIWPTNGSLVILKSVKIRDKPKFAYRGLLIDTARNFIPLDGLKRVLVGMAANKLNVFHWHISDSQSFPFEIKRLPLLTKYGAYSDEMTYNEDDVKDLVNYARVRGIRVVIEVDTPAHAGNGWTWGPQEGLGELAVCVNARPWNLYCGEPPCGQLNPENPNVYNILEQIYRAIFELTEEDEIFHIGGDEVNLECWSQFLPKTANYTDLHELWGNFTLKSLDKLKSANNNKMTKFVIIWSSNLTKRPYSIRYLNRDYVVVQSWGASQWSDTTELLADGYKVIISHVDAWYLDCGFGRWRETGEGACDPYRPWQTMYNHQPWMETTKHQILGGEACLWSEQLDVASLDTRLWPRTAAFAERLWSDPPVNNEYYAISEDVYTRLTNQRQRLINRGLAAEALWPAWCTENPGMCL